MRILLKYDGLFFKAYWVRRRQSAICGWFGGPALFRAFFPGSPPLPRDIHFTYPPDGNLHFSFKYFAPEGTLLRVEYVFSDHARVKSFAPGSAPLVETRPRDEHAAREQFGMGFRPPSFDVFASQPHVFQFPLAAIPSVSANNFPRAFSAIAAPRNDDLVVDLAQHGTGVFNLCAFLLGNGSALPSSEPPGVLQVKVDDTAYPHIRLQSLFMPTATA